MRSTIAARDVCTVASFVGLLTASLATTGFAAQPGQAPCTSTVVGDLRVESFDSGVYGDRRTIRVWLPPGYDAVENARRTYPVLYMFDGQTLFDACTAFKGEEELKIDETMTALIAARTVPPLIVVGIDSSTQRQHEYRPYPDVFTAPAAPPPIGSRLPAFVVDEVMARVSGRFRVTTNAMEAGIGGTSLGAVAALHVLLARSDRFGIGLIESANLTLGNGQLLRDTALIVRGPDRIYIGVGSAELDVPGGDKYAAFLRTSLANVNAGWVRMAETLANHFRAALVNRPEVTLVVEPNGRHLSEAWARRFPRAVSTLYGPAVER